jgi:hypothetical protein
MIKYFYIILTQIILCIYPLYIILITKLSLYKYCVKILCHNIISQKKKFVIK